MVSLRRVAPNMSDQRSRSGLIEGVIRREATETEELVSSKDKGPIIEVNNRLSRIELCDIIHYNFQCELSTK